MVGLSCGSASVTMMTMKLTPGDHVLAVGGAARGIVACLRAHGASNAILAQNCCRAMANLMAKCGTLGNTTAASEIFAAGGFEATSSHALWPTV